VGVNYRFILLKPIIWLGFLSRSVYRRARSLPNENVKSHTLAYWQLALTIRGGAALDFSYRNDIGSVVIGAKMAACADLPPMITKFLNKSSVK